MKKEKVLPNENRNLTTNVKVSGMDCSDEVNAIKNALDLEGILSVNANIVNETVSVSHNTKISSTVIKNAIQKTGVKIVEAERESFFDNNQKRIALITSSGGLLGLGLLFTWLKLFNQNAVDGLFFISIVFSGVIVFPKAWRALSQKTLDMNVLMTFAVIGAVFIKEYSEAASVVFLFALAELLEAMSVARARKAIKDVLKVSYKKARVVINGDLQEIPVEELKVGAHVLVKPGETIPVDGKIFEGNSSINEASLTGESKLIQKKVNDQVWAGTLNGTGALQVIAEKEFKDTKIAKVIALVEEAQGQKAPSQRFVDKFASIYTPAILVFSLLVAIVPPVFFSQDWNDWLYKALVFLVIGCPCALVIATPVSVVSGLTSLARNGVLVKGGVYLEALGKLKAIGLDKTGTITEGKPKVLDFKAFIDKPEDEILRITSSLESMSPHPLAAAILDYSALKGVKIVHPADYKNIVGRGAEGSIEGHRYFVGNHKMAHELGICTPEVESFLDEIESKAMSVIVLGHRPHEGCEGEIWAVFAVGDKIRKNIPRAIKELHSSGVELVTMLSGDNQKTATAVGKQVGIDYVRGGLLPDDKVVEVKNLVDKYKYVAMVGDGVNDAPALAHATIGIAMGGAGSDTAIETADIALIKDDILELPKAIKQGRRVLNIIRFNIYFAILIKVIFFVLAFLGLANLWTAVASDMGASLLVTFNALRLLR